MAMMRLDASGCMDRFGEYNKRRGDTRALVFKVDNPRDPHHIEVDAAVPKGDGGAAEDWPAVCACLPQDDCRYVLCGLSWEAEDGHTASKQVFVLWSPSQAPIKTKLVYSASTGSLKQALQGSWTNHQAGSEDGLEYETVLQRAKDSCTCA